MGVDIPRLRALPACRLDPSKFAMATQTIVNSDSNLVVVITDSFNQWVNVLSTGPLVAMNKAHGFNHLLSDSALWIRDEASFNSFGVGHPIVVSADRNRSSGQALLSPLYIWTEDDREERNWMKQLLADRTIEEVARMIGRRPALYIQPTNQAPGLNDLVGEARARRLIGEHPDLAGAQLAIASGVHHGASSVDII